MNAKLDTIIDQLKNLTLLEAAELVTVIEKTFGVDTSVSTASVVIPAASSTPVDVEEEKTAFDLILSEVPSDKKIAILKIIRNITGLGLKESKDIVDNTPKVVKEGITKEESDAFKKELEAAGAKVIIK
jgi:large subunit ribosomal protein L7/L12